MIPAFLLPRPTSTCQVGVLRVSASVGSKGASKGASLAQDGQLGTKLSSQAVTRVAGVRRRETRVRCERAGAAKSVDSGSSRLGGEWRAQSAYAD